MRFEWLGGGIVYMDDVYLQLCQGIRGDDMVFRQRKE